MHLQTCLYRFDRECLEEYGMCTVLALIIILVASVKHHRNSHFSCVATALSTGMHMHGPFRDFTSAALAWQVLIYSFNLRNRWRFRHVPGPTPAWFGGNLPQVS